MKPRKSSLSEKPIRQHSRRLVDWLNLAGAKKVHSLVDKIYKMKNLELAWEKVRQNKGAGGMDGESIKAFEKQAAVNLQRLHGELKSPSRSSQGKNPDHRTGFLLAILKKIIFISSFMALTR